MGGEGVEGVEGFEESVDDPCEEVIVDLLRCLVPGEGGVRDRWNCADMEDMVEFGHGVCCWEADQCALGHPREEGGVIL